MARSEPRGGREAREGSASLARMEGVVWEFAGAFWAVGGSLRFRGGAGTNRGHSMLDLYLQLPWLVRLTVPLTVLVPS